MTDVTRRWAGAVAWSAAGVSVVGLLLTYAGSVAWPGPDGAFDNLWIMSWLGFPIVGAMIASRRPTTRIGWFLVALGLCFASGLTGSGYGELVLGQQVLDLPAAPYALWAGSVAFVPAFVLIAMLILHFPGDRLPSRRWRLPVSAALVVAALDLLAWAVRPVFKVLAGKVVVPNPMAVPALADVAEWTIVVTSYALAGFGLAVGVNAVWRYIRARGEQRLQMKWFALAVAAFPLMFALGLFSEGVIGRAASNRLVVLAFVVGFNGLAVAIAVAVLRYRLYEIDRVVSRTVTYAVVTAVIAFPYLLVVPVVTGVVSSDLAVAGATLAAAAAFNPLRRRVQARVDRRFNRARYDAARTVDDFSSRLRDEVDLDQLSRDLLAVVHQTMQPASASLWLRGTSVA